MMEADHEREDGRLAAQVRPQNCDRRLIEQADGSAQWTQDKTAVLASITGPFKSPNARTDDATRAVVAVTFLADSGPAGPKEQQCQEIIRQTVASTACLTQFPRTCIQVTVQVLNDDGGVLSAALNAVSVALVEAGIPMTSAFAAISVALDDGGAVLVDPTKQEESAATSHVVVAVSHTRQLDADGTPAPAGQVLLCHATGLMSMDAYLDMLEVCEAGARHVADFQTSSLQQAFQP